MSLPRLHTSCSPVEVSAIVYVDVRIRTSALRTRPLDYWGFVTNGVIATTSKHSGSKFVRDEQHKGITSVIHPSPLFVTECVISMVLHGFNEDNVESYRAEIGRTLRDTFGIRRVNIAINWQ